MNKARYQNDEWIRFAKKLNRRGYWSRKNRTRNRLLEEQLNTSSLSNSRIKPSYTATTQLYVSTIIELHKTISELTDNLFYITKKHAQTLEVSQNIILQHNKEIQELQKPPVHENRLVIHENHHEIAILPIKEYPVHEDHEITILENPVNEMREFKFNFPFKEISIPEKYLDTNKRKHAEVLYKEWKWKKVCTKY